MKKTILISAICAICTQAQSQWQITGNAGTNTSTNFIGTTDAKAFKIRTNNAVRITINTSGKVGIGTSSPVFKLDVKGGSINTDSLYRIGGNTVLSIKGGYNLFAGVGSGFSITTGEANTASGFQSLYSNTEGNFNTANGYNALQYNTKGYNNSAYGANALLSNTTASENTAIGNSALYAQSYSNGGVDWVSGNVAVGSFALLSNQPGNTLEGIYNTAIGHSALRSNTTGSYNAANGFQALYSNVGGFRNTANGAYSLKLNSSGSFNTANGYNSLTNNTSSNHNTAIGSNSLAGNTTASQNTAIGSDALGVQNYNPGFTWDSKNTAVGYFALKYNQPTSTGNGKENTAVGHTAMYSNTIGYSNTAIGYSALYSNSFSNGNTAIGKDALYVTTGALNTGIGYNTLATNTSGSNNTGIGNGANVSAASLSYATAIGANATVSATDKVRIGDAGVMVVEGQVAYSWPSDGRFKENVKEDVKGLDFIMKLKPVSYNFNRLKYAQHVKQSLTPDREKTLVKQSQNRSTGFIAQEVEKIIEQTGFTSFDAVHAPTNETDNYSMGYAAFVVPLVKAVQELNKTNEELKSRIEKLESILSDKTSSTYQPNNYSSTSLEQNSPNPFNSQTEIKFQLPSTFSSAQLIIIDANGKQVRNEVLKSSSSVIIHASELSAGAYSYSLIIDGVNVDTKQMVLTK